MEIVIVTRIRMEEHGHLLRSFFGYPRIFSEPGMRRFGHVRLKVFEGVHLERTCPDIWARVDEGDRAIAFYLSERSVSAIQKAIDLLKIDAEYRQILAEAGLRIAKQRSIDKRAGRFVDIFKQVVENNR